MQFQLSYNNFVLVVSRDLQQTIWILSQTCSCKRHPFEPFWLMATEEVLMCRKSFLIRFSNANLQVAHGWHRRNLQVIQYDPTSHTSCLSFCSRHSISSVSFMVLHLRRPWYDCVSCVSGTRIKKVVFPVISVNFLSNCSTIHCITWAIWRHLPIFVTQRVEYSSDLVNYSLSELLYFQPKNCVVLFAV